jgi:hypothetical protein
MQVQFNQLPEQIQASHKNEQAQGAIAVIYVYDKGTKNEKYVVRFAGADVHWTNRQGTWYYEVKYRD